MKNLKQLLKRLFCKAPVMLSLPSDKAIEEQASKKECNWEQMVYFREGAKWMRQEAQRVNGA